MCSFSDGVNPKLKGVRKSLTAHFIANDGATLSITGNILRITLKEKGYSIFAFAMRVQGYDLIFKFIKTISKRLVLSLIRAYL